MGAPEGDDHPLRFEPHRVRALTHTADSTRPCTPDCTVNSISNVYVISVFDKNVNPGDPEATVSSASLRSPWGRRAIGRVGARTVRSSMPPASPTGRADGHGGSGCLAPMPARMRRAPQACVRRRSARLRRRRP